MAIQAGLSGAVNPEAVAAARGGIVHRRSLVDDVYERLIQLLLDSELEPGERIPIDGLARAWEVSPTPVREALVRAESSGLVVRQALKGYQVAPLLPPEEFERLMEMRLLIEPYCTARATERADANLLAVLEQQHEAMEHSPTGPTSREYREYMRADVAFHETIAAASGNHFLQTALSATNTHAHRFRRFSGTVSDALDAIHEHLDVLNAIRAHDPERASAAMRTHLEGVAERGRVTD